MQNRTSHSATRRAWATSWALLAVLIAAACAPAATAPTESLTAATPKWGGTLVVGEGFLPHFMNTNYDIDTQAPYLNMNVYSKLLQIDDATFTLYGDLAKSWDISPDGLTYTFRLYEGVKWHDGKPFSSADVKWTYDDILKEGTKAASYQTVSNVSEVLAPDANTVVFKIKEPSGAFLFRLADYQFGANILPKHLYEGTDVRKNPYNLKPIGTGPFKVVSLTAGQQMVMEANPDYYGAGPYLDRLIFQVIPNVATMMAALETGDVGFSATSPPFADVARLKTLPGVNVEPSRSDVMLWTAFNLENPKFKDLRVRMAIAHAIDNTLIGTQVYGGLVQPATGTYTSAVPAHFNAAAKQPAYDPALAEKLLDEAGYPRAADGVRFRTRYAAWIFGSLFGGPEIGQVIKQQLAKVGIEVDLSVTQFNLFAETIIKKRDFDLSLSGGPHGPDGSTFANFVRTGGSRNVMPYSNPRVDELFKQGATSSDPEQRKNAYYEIQTILAKELPKVGHIEYMHLRATRSEFHNFYWSPAAAGKASQHMFNTVWTDTGSTTNPRTQR